ncbi:MAG: hypothetical protein V1646_01645 [bacterium]
MLKSNYDIKIGFNMAKSRSSAFVLRFFKLKLEKLKLEKVKYGFLLIELMMAIFIGLVLISSLMRMQSLLLELQDSFYMRDKALVLAVEYLERGDLDENVDSKSTVLASNGRDFRFNFDKNFLDQNSLDKTKLIAKVKVEWKSLVGKNCCLEI